MDMKNFQPTEPVIVVEITNPKTGEKLTNDCDDSVWTVSFHAPHTNKYKEYLWSVSDERIAESVAGKSSDFTAKDLDESGVDLLVNTICGWNITYDGAMPPFTKELARGFINDIPWFKSQLENGLIGAQVFMMD